MINTTKYKAAIQVIGLTSLLTCATAQAQVGRSDRQTYCSFRPQSPSCEEVYRQSLRDPSPTAMAVKAAYEGYGRYVRAAQSGLTEDDRRYLKENGISLPAGMNGEDQAGLHALLADPRFQKNDIVKAQAVNNYISRAVQAELYCAFDPCETSTSQASPLGAGT